MSSGVAGGRDDLLEIDVDRRLRLLPIRPRACREDGRGQRREPPQLPDATHEASSTMLKARFEAEDPKYFLPPGLMLIRRTQQANAWHVLSVAKGFAPANPSCRMNSGIASEGFVICGDHPGSGVIPGFSGRTGQNLAEGPRAAIQAPRPNAWETCGLPAGVQTSSSSRCPRRLRIAADEASS